MVELWTYLHIGCAMVGYGGIALDLVHTSQLRRFRGAEAYAVASADYAVSRSFAEYFLYGVLVFGLTAALAADVSLGETWLSASFLVYALSLAALHGLVNPARRRSLVLLGQLAGHGGVGERGQEQQLAALGRRMALGQSIFVLTGMVALALMVWQPD